jgi:aspartate/methionine/tyrosine aminotransferase
MNYTQGNNKIYIWLFQIQLPPKAVQAALAKGVTLEEFYALELLEKTGVSVALGSAFGLKESFPESAPYIR